MSNSPLVTYRLMSPNCTSPRRGKIKKITIHHMAGNLSLRDCGQGFASPARGASANYGIDSQGRVGQFVDECDRAWTSSSPDNDHQAVTIEVANDQIGGNWHVSDKALAATIDLCVDICKRNGIKRLNFTGDARGNLTMHRYFIATACPGPYLVSKFGYIATAVNAKLSGAAPQEPYAGVLYRVQTGAFKSKDKAVALEAKVKKAGFDTYITNVNGLYKVQVGAYSKRDNATVQAANLKVAGFDCFVTTNDTSGTGTVTTINEGSKVMIKPGAKTYAGSSVASFVYSGVYTVDELRSDRAVLDKNGICTPFNVSDLILA